MSQARISDVDCESVMPTPNSKSLFRRFDPDQFTVRRIGQHIQIAVGSLPHVAEAPKFSIEKALFR